jgi:hypothetical protein
VRFVVPCSLLVACGRLDFDRGSDTVVDHCASNPVAPDPVTIRGKTFRYTSFDNNRTAVADVVVSETSAMTTSDANGDYALAVPTGGESREITIAYAKTGYLTTRVVFDHAIDRDVTGRNVPRFELGDAPIWTATQMDMIYDVASNGTVARDPARGILNIAVRDCGGSPIAGATVAISPTPEVFTYQGDDGRPIMGTATFPLFANAFGFNAVGGPTTIEVTHPDHAFLPFVVNVFPGDFNTLAIARSLE